MVMLDRVSSGPLWLLIRFCGPQLSLLCKACRLVVDRLWLELCVDLWFTRRSLTVAEVAPGGKEGRLLRLMRAAACDIPHLESPKEFYLRLRRSQVRDVDRGTCLERLPPYTRGDSVLVKVADRPIARSLGNIVVFLEPFQQESHLSLLSSDNTPLKSSYSLSVTRDQKTDNFTINPCHHIGRFETVTLSLDLQGKSVLIHVLKIDDSERRPEEEGGDDDDRVKNAKTTTIIRPFAPLDFDPVLSSS